MNISTPFLFIFAAVLMGRLMEIQAFFVFPLVPFHVSPTAEFHVKLYGLEMWSPKTCWYDTEGEKTKCQTAFSTMASARIDCSYYFHPAVNKTHFSPEQYSNTFSITILATPMNYFNDANSELIPTGIFKFDDSVTSARFGINCSFPDMEGFPISGNAPSVPHRANLTDLLAQPLHGFHRRVHQHLRHHGHNRRSVMYDLTFRAVNIKPGQRSLTTMPVSPCFSPCLSHNQSGCNISRLHDENSAPQWFCQVCLWVTSFLQKGAERAVAASKTIDALCGRLFWPLSLACRYAVDQMIDGVEDALKHNPLLQPETLCEKIHACTHHGDQKFREVTKDAIQIALQSNNFGDGQHGWDGCTGIINEINPDTKARKSTKKFLELNVVCINKKDETGHYPSAPETDDPIHVLLGVAVGGKVAPYADFYARIPAYKIANFVKGEEEQELPSGDLAEVYQKLFVVGEESVSPAPNLPFTSTNVVYFPHEAEKKGSIMNFLTADDSLLRAMLLLKFRHKPDDELQLSAPFVSTEGETVTGNGVKLTSELLHLIQPNVMDAVIFAAKSGLQKCNFLEQLMMTTPAAADLNYVLRKIDTNVEYSLNQCAEYFQPFLADTFKYGKPSPGEKNDCTGATINYNEISTKVFPADASDTVIVDIDEELDEEEFCRTKESMDFKSLPDEKVERFVSDKMKEAEESGATVYAFEGDESAEMEIEEVEAQRASIQNVADTEPTQPAIKRKAMEIVDPNEEITTEKYYKPNDRLFISKHCSSYFNTNWFDNKNYMLKTWLELVRNHENPEHSLLRCRICSQWHNLELGSGRSQNKPKSWINGFPINKFKDSARPLEVMRKNIDEHVHGKDRKNVPMHNVYIEAFRRKKVQGFKESINLLERKAEDSEMGPQEHLTATANLLRLVYTEVKVNLALFNHETMCQVLSTMGLNVGNRHRSRLQASRIVNFLSYNYQYFLLRYISELNRPFAITLDAQTDSTSKHIVNVNFRAVENGVPRVYFYKMINLGQDASAQGYLNGIKKAVTDDDTMYRQAGKNIQIDDVFKKWLFSVGTDGAAVMIGKNNGLIKKMSDNWIHRPLFGVWCSAHQLQLIAKRAWKDNEVYGISAIEEFMESLSKFFYFSYKRTAGVIEFCAMLLQQFSPLGNLSKTRWVAGDERVVVKFLKDYVPIALYLDNVEQKKEPQAVYLYNVMTNKNLLLMMHFLADIFPILSFLSKQFQREAGLIFERKENIMQCIDQLESKKSADKVGKFMIQFLSEVTCWDEELRQINETDWESTFVNQSPCETQERYNNAKRVTFKGIELRDKSTIPRPGTKKRANFPILNKIQHQMIEDLINGMKEQFGINSPPQQEPQVIGKLDTFDFLTPSKLPKNAFQILDYGVEEITYICTTYPNLCNGESTDAVVENFHTLLQYLVRHSEYLNKINAGPLPFWAKFEPMEAAPWNVALKNIVHAALVTPPASADIERTFSVYNYIKSDRKQKLSDESMDAILRLGLNGPHPTKFAAYKMAKLWSISHLRADVPGKDVATPLEVKEALRMDYEEEEEQRENRNEGFFYQETSKLFL